METVALEETLSCYIWPLIMELLLEINYNIQRLA
jgi:hypothetical protein